MDLKSRKHSFGQNAFHFVWKIKYAKDPFKFYGLRMDCEFFLRQVAYRKGFKIYELYIGVDHVHLLLRCLQPWVLVWLFNCLKDTVPLSFSKNILGWETILEKDIFGVLENSLGALAIQLWTLLTTTSNLLNLGFVDVNIFLVIDTSRFSAGSFILLKLCRFFKNFKERFEKKPKGSEYWWEIKKRMYNFLKKINEKYNDKNILIISHEAPITLLEGAVMGIGYLQKLENIGKNQK